jgi:hypothetical protein
MDKDIEILWIALERSVAKRQVTESYAILSDIKSIYENFEREILEKT